MVNTQQLMAKCTLKEFEEVSKVSNTSPKTRIWSFLKMNTRFFASLAAVPFVRAHRSHHRLHRAVAAF